jgi:hypothetical protein
MRTTDRKRSFLISSNLVLYVMINTKYMIIMTDYLQQKLMITYATKMAAACEHVSASVLSLGFVPKKHVNPSVN